VVKCRRSIYSNRYLDVLCACEVEERGIHSRCLYYSKSAEFDSNVKSGPEGSDAVQGGSKAGVTLRILRLVSSEEGSSRNSILFVYARDNILN